VAGRSVEVLLELDPALGDTVVERERLDQVLLNLAANGRDAMPRGGTLTIGTANVVLDEAAAGEAQCPGNGSYVALRVTDTGEGMKPEVREHIFERFFTTKEVSRGTGLGLATAHGFARQSGGCIAVRSAPGQGTTVVVYLPQTASAVQAVPTPRAEPEARGGTETIVVVEPDDQVRGAVRSVLKARGYRVIDAPTGPLALRQAELSQTPVRLVLADASARGTAGREVVERLRRSGHPATMLLVSGATDRSLVDLGLEEAPLLRKVFCPDELARRVRETLDAPRSTPRAKVSG
jgi:CheY-like chemotaxis protein